MRKAQNGKHARIPAQEAPGGGGRGTSGHLLPGEQENREKAEPIALAWCEKYRREYPSAVECLWRDYDACLTFYSFPVEHWKAIRTTNAIERLIEEVKRRSHKMGAAFRNEESCLLMFYAVIRGVKF